MGLEFLFCRFFVGARPGATPRLRTGNGIGNAMSCGMCGDDHRHWLGTTGPPRTGGTLRDHGGWALMPRPAGEMAVALRLGQFIGNLLQQHQRIGAAGV